MFLPTADIFNRTYETQTTIVVKETYAHKTQRLIVEKFGKDAPNAIAVCQRESGCRFNAVNQSSGACGIPQALPCSKMGCGLTAQDIECQILWYHAYVLGRYGSGGNALAFWLDNQWY